MPQLSLPFMVSVKDNNFYEVASPQIISHYYSLLFVKYYQNYQVEGGEVDRACSMNVRDENCVRTPDWKICKEVSTCDT
jgi:hypothetical protein